MNASELNQLLKTLETSLLSPEVRSSKVKLDKLLSDNFIEFGASGRVYNKQDILNHLPLESSLKIEASEFKFNQLSKNIIQLTYKSHSKEYDKKTRYTLRSSIWVNNQYGWQMAFHQGTVTEP